MHWSPNKAWVKCQRLLASIRGTRLILLKTRSTEKALERKAWQIWEWNFQMLTGFRKERRHLTLDVPSQQPPRSLLPCQGAKIKESSVFRILPQQIIKKEANKWNWIENFTRSLPSKPYKMNGSTEQNYFRSIARHCKWRAALVLLDCTLCGAMSRQHTTTFWICVVQLA